MTTRILRWGLLSTARINTAVITPLRASARNQLTAVASRSAEQAASYAKEWGIPRHFGSYEALLADPQIDVVYISLPNSLHPEWAIKAAQAGKHVLCEKPMALEPEDVDAIAAAGKRAGVVIAEAFMYRHHPLTLKIKELVDGGAIGKLKHVRGGFSFPLNRPADVRFDPVLGGGSIWDIGCYPISYTRTVVGAEPESVFGWQVTSQSGVDESFVGQMRFPGEVYGQFDCSFRAAERMLMEFVGEKGMLSLTHAYKPGLDETIHFMHADGTTENIIVPGQELYIGEVEDMADAILLGKPPRISLADSRGNAATISALLRSARAGWPVALAA